MPEYVLEGLKLVAQWLEIIGAGALLLGFAYATMRCIAFSLQEEAKSAVKDYRQALGRTVLIGLEILVAATIIKTITLEPTLEGASVLAIMVAVRTMLGWTMALEISGRWPWQRPPAKPAKS